MGSVNIYGAAKGGREMKCQHKRWRTLVKGRSWKCRECGWVKTKHGEVTSIAAMRDLMPKGK